MKKLWITILMGLITFNLTEVIYANSAAPIIGEDGSGLIFEKNDKIKINKEELYIDMVSNDIAKVKAVYEMENLTDEDISNLSTLFVTYNEHDYYLRDKNVEIKVNDAKIDYQYRYYPDFKNGFETEENLDWEKIIADSTTKKINSDETYYLYEIKDKQINAFYLFNNTKPIILLESNGTIKKTTHDIITDDREYWHNCLYFNLNDTAKGIRFLSPENDLLLLTVHDKEFEYSLKQVGYITTYFLENINLAEAEMSTLFGFINFALEDPEVANRYQVGIMDLSITIPGYLSGIMNCYSLFAVEYFLDFLPKEKIIVSVEYDYQVSYVRGGMFENGYIEFKYLLSPAKYWNDFKDLTIYLTLNPIYSKLKSSTVDFTLEEDVYVFHSNDLPDTELIIQMQASRTSGCTYKANN